MDKVANLKSRPGEDFFTANPNTSKIFTLCNCLKLKCTNSRIITYTMRIKATTALTEWRVSYGLETWEIEFAFVRNVRKSCWVHSACCPIGKLWALIRDRRPGRDTNHQLVPRTNVGILCNYTSNLPHIFIAWCLLKCRVIRIERSGCWGLRFRKACTECNETKVTRVRNHGELDEFTPFFHSITRSRITSKTTRALYMNHPVQGQIYSHPQKPNANIDTTKCH